jgi:hypothetical protein
LFASIAVRPRKKQNQRLLQRRSKPKLDAFIEEIEDQGQRDSAKTIGEGALNLIQRPNDQIQECQEHLTVLLDLLKNDSENHPRAIARYIDQEYKNLIQQIDNAQTAELEKVGTYFETIPENSLEKKTVLRIKTEVEKQITDSYATARSNLKNLYEGDSTPAAEKDKPAPGLKAKFDKEVDKAEQEVFMLNLYVEGTNSKRLKPAALSAGAGKLGDDPRKYRDTNFDAYAKESPDRETVQDYLRLLVNQNHYLRTPGGLLIKRTSDSGISISIPSSYNFVYHDAYDNLLGADLLTIMHDIVAKGHDSVTITIDIADEKLRQKVMEEAYVAARLAGIPDDKIMFNVHGFKNKEEDIAGKPATDIITRLGDAPTRVMAKLQVWNKDKEELENKRAQRVGTQVLALDHKIKKLCKGDEINAQAHQSSDAVNDTESAEHPEVTRNQPG